MNQKMIRPDMLPKTPNLWYSWKVKRYNGDETCLRVHLAPLWGLGKEYKSDSISLFSGYSYEENRAPRAPADVVRRVTEEAERLLQTYERKNAKKIEAKRLAKVRKMYTGVY